MPLDMDEVVWGDEGLRSKGCSGGWMGCLFAIENIADGAYCMGARCQFGSKFYTLMDWPVA